MHRTQLVLHLGLQAAVHKGLPVLVVARSRLHSKHCLKRFAHLAGLNMVCSNSVEVDTGDTRHSGCLHHNMAQTVEGDSPGQA